MKERAQRALEWWKDSRPGRTLAWYGARNGAQLCGGIAYSALFSLFAALTIGWSIFSSLLGARSDLRDAVFAQVDVWVPGLIGSDPETAVLQPDEITLPSAFNTATLVALVVGLVSALGVMAALRRSVRAMFGVLAQEDNALLARVWQLVGFLVLGTGIVASAAASVSSRAVGNVVEDWLGGSWPVAVAIGAGAAAVGVVIDALVVAGIVVLVGGVRPGRRDLVLGCLTAGVVAGVLRWVGTSVVVGSGDRNALLAAGAAVVTILVLVNFVARVLLMVCAWMYDPPRLDELERAEHELTARRHAEEVDRIVQQGQGQGRPWSPFVRGYRRALLS
ncbi:hypothetical protein DNL40_01535 [Xylanimonas oleitrophica]|uniref:YihY/virulence factor BrkB family protein n=1 Tax=Xylanimonas oleitrophica TaxID=2607479 RepID=A0A2W5X4T3_9MICO|nr:hypothetical protein DNL40_01535 [Xylanimonas oleitrophica]